MSGLVVWFTGLPSSGKSTLAAKVKQLVESHSVHPERSRGTSGPSTSLGVNGAVTLGVNGRPSVLLLDGDEVRAALRPVPGYSEPERDAFYETLARLAALLAHQGCVVLVPATAHLRRFRERARSLAPAFLEIYVDTPPDECRRRDAKGLYTRAEANLPGGGVTYEVPERPDLVISPDDQGAAARISATIFAFLVAVN